jgi:fluoride ion exporter CrcB/FEX
LLFLAMEEKILSILRFLHGSSGLIALVIAPLAMIAYKGGSWHRRWGITFFYAMAVVTVTAIALAWLQPNPLMGMVAVFSFHMIASGYRSLYHKKLHRGQRPARMDLILQGTAGVINVGLLLWGAAHFMLKHRDPMAGIFLAFGLIGSLMVFANLRRFFKQSHDKQEWLYGHMTGFLGGYIATVSAFSAVNLGMIQPLWLRWLWPTIVGAPLIALWVRHYRGRFARGRRVRELMDTRIQ